MLLRRRMWSVFENRAYFVKFFVRKCKRMDYQRDIEMSTDTTFDLTMLPGFDVTKASNWVGGTETAHCERDGCNATDTRTAAGTALPETQKPEFVDVPSEAYYADAVDWAAATGVTAGVDNTHFGPDEGCTRAQMVSFLWRAAGEPEPETIESPFTDVQDPNEYYYKAVL